MSIKEQVLLDRLLALMSPVERAAVRNNTVKSTEDQIVEWVAGLVNDRDNLQNAVDDTLEKLRKTVYDLGNA